MGNGERSSYMGGGGEERTTKIDCDVGLGLNMQKESDESPSYPCKRTMVSPHHQFTPFQYHQQQFGTTSFHGGYGGSGGGSLFCDATSTQVVACMSDIFDASLGASSAVFSTVADGSTKAPFTASQWHELERQTMIYKYLMASNNLPADLLLPLTKNTSHVSVAQSNTSGLDLKFSSGLDPEPWRCKRTDGKKWRCSRDVAPDQKYCERHAHKSRPRSRKHVEIQPHNAAAAATSTTTTTDYSEKQQQQSHPLIFQDPISHSTTMASATAYDQARNSNMWFMRGASDTTPVSTCNQQRQQQQQQMMTQSSSRMGLNREIPSSYNRNISVFRHQYDDKQETININPFVYCDNSGDQRIGNYHLNEQYGSNSYLDHKMASAQGSLSDDHTTSIHNTTRHFIDAWSRTAAEKTRLDEIRNKGSSSISSSRKLPLSSLTLSMSGGNVIDEDNKRVIEMGIGVTNEDEDGLRSELMMSPVSWMNSTTTPGGPLGEALCLGINAGTAKGSSSNLPSPRGGYSNSSATSSCSKGSCEDGSHQFNFIG